MLPPESSSFSSCWSTASELVHEPLVECTRTVRGTAFGAQQKQALFVAGGGSNTPRAGVPPVVSLVLFAAMLLFAFSGGLVFAWRMSHGHNEGRIYTAGGKRPLENT